MSTREPRLLLYYPPNHGLVEFAEAYARGMRSERSHWSMHLAAEHGFAVGTTANCPCPRLAATTRKLTHRILGFDLPHLLANWRNVLCADAVWGMSEREMLPVLLLLRLLRRPAGQAPVVIGDVVWLLDEWKTCSWLRRAWLRFLFARVDGFLAVSERVERQLRAIFPGVPVTMYRLGTPAAAFEKERGTVGPGDDLGSGRPIRVFALGNDQRRDWTTFAEALGGDKRFEVVVASRLMNMAPRPLAEDINIRIDRAADFRKVKEYMVWADLLVMPLLPNEHGAGLTSLLEAVAARLPVICTRIGGIDEYFSDDAISYVPPGDPGAIRNAVLEIAENPQIARARSSKAKAELHERGYEAEKAVVARCAFIKALIAAREPIEPTSPD